MNAMDGIMEVRNLFAHILLVRFNSGEPNMLKALKKLDLHVTERYYIDPDEDEPAGWPVEEITDEKSRFIVNLGVQSRSVVVQTQP